MGNPVLVDKESTTIFDCLSATFQLPDSSYVNCEVMDTGGQEKFDSLNRQYYQRADCCVLVYDITNKESFQQCKEFYKQEIIDNCKKDIKVILVGNKTDLENDRVISKEEGANFAEENKYYFKETSCETNSNVADAFETIIIITNNDMIKDNQLNLEDNMNVIQLKNDNDNLDGEKKIKKQGVTHDETLANITDRTIHLKDGEVST